MYKDNQKQLAFTYQGQQSTFPAMPQEYINSPVLCHNIIHRDLDCLESLQSITLGHCIDDILLAGSDEQKVTSILDTLEGHI